MVWAESGSWSDHTIGMITTAGVQGAAPLGKISWKSTLGTSHTKLVVSETVCMCIATYSLQKLLQMTQGHNIYIFLRIPN